MNPPFGHVLRQLNAVHPTTHNSLTNVGMKEMQPVFYPKCGAN